MWGALKGGRCRWRQSPGSSPTSSFNKTPHHQQQARLSCTKPPFPPNYAQTRQHGKFILTPPNKRCVANTCPVRPLQLPIPPPRHPPPNLHLRLRASLLPRHHGSQQGRRHGDLLEGRPDRRATESVYQYMLCAYGGELSNPLATELLEKSLCVRSFSLSGKDEALGDRRGDVNFCLIWEEG